MKIVVFAGGSGTRFWPISREKYPKQFKPLLNGKSTFETHIDDYLSQYDLDDVLIATTEKLSSTVKEIYPEIPLHNIFTEPVRRDLGPAVAMVMLKLAKMGNGKEPTAIIWSDAVIKDKEDYFHALKLSEEMLLKDGNQLIYLGEEAKYPNENIGWIELGEKLTTDKGLTVYARKSFTYRPEKTKAEKWFKEKTHLWNTGYFITTPDFIIEQYKHQQPAMYKLMEVIADSLDTDREFKTIQKNYPEMQVISFDNAILENLDNKFTKVIAGTFEWADPGTLYALKQFLHNDEEENVTKGLVHNYKTHDSLVYNYDEGKLVSTIGLEGFIVVNTPDALLVCHKDQIPEIKNMLKQFEDTDLKKYL